MYNPSKSTTYATWWRQTRLRLILLYVIIAIVLLAIGVMGQLRILRDLGKTFGGFFWAVDTNGRVIIVSTLPQTSSFASYTSSVANSDRIVGIAVVADDTPVFSWQQARAQDVVPLMQAYQHARPGDAITYTIEHADNTRAQILLPALQFSWDIWWQSYGLAFIAGAVWLVTGFILLLTAQDWNGAVESLTLLPPAILFLAYSYLGNVQTTYSGNFIVQLLWVPSFALLGAAFIHLSLMYRPEAMSGPRMIQATSLLLHADAHLRSVLSQRIHDQPKQQAQRIRALLGQWQQRLRVEAERDATGKVAAQPVIEALTKLRGISEELASDLRGLQILVEDAYQRRSLGLKLHLEKLIREDLPALHPESPLTVQLDLWALDALSSDLEETEEGVKVAEAISYTVTQALLNVYNHADASLATVQAACRNSTIEVTIHDNGCGFDPGTVPPEKTSLFKARLKAREAGGSISISATPALQPEHGTTIVLHLPMPHRQPGFLCGPLGPSSEL